MADQSPTPTDLLNERLETVQKISALTAEHLRLTQAISGFQVLELADDGTSQAEIAERQAAVDRCEAEIDALEERVRALDHARIALENAGQDT